jgi:hypothetical protein
MDDKYSMAWLHELKVNHLCSIEVESADNKGLDIQLAGHSVGVVTLKC